MNSRLPSQSVDWDQSRTTASILVLRSNAINGPFLLFILVDIRGIKSCFLHKTQREIKPDKKRPSSPLCVVVQ